MTFEEIMLKVVAAAYGSDETTAGLTVAYLPEKKSWYASIVRYPGGKDGEKLVVAHGYSKISLNHATKMLCLSWLQKKRPRGTERFWQRVQHLLNDAKQQALR